MTDSQTRFAAMPLKQKLSAIAFFIVGAFILYEVIGLFRGSGSSSTPAPATSAKPATMTATTPPSPTPAAPKGLAPKPAPGQGPGPTASSPPPAAPAPAPSGSSAATALLSRPEAAAVPPPTPALMNQNQEQGNYISAINQLQMLKIQREMAETNQAIVAAKLATVTAEKSISEMLTPEIAPAPVPVKKEASSEGPGGVSYVESGGGKTYYLVQSVTMEMDQWHAVISLKDKLYNVAVGDVLPYDGAVVTGIDQKGVTLEIAGSEQRLPYQSTDYVPQQQPVKVQGLPPMGGLQTPPAPPPLGSP